MFYNYFQTNDFDYNECTGMGMCSIAPVITAFQEVMLILMRITAYYVLKLEKFDYDCEKLKTDIINNLSNLISSTVYSDEQMLDLVICRYSDMIRLKREYAAACLEKQTGCKDIKQPLKLTLEMSLSDILTCGQRAIQAKRMDSDQKCIAELLFVSIKSVSLSVVKLLDYDITDNNAINQVLKAINLFNFTNFPVNKAKATIKLLAKTDLELWKQRREAQFKAYGNVDETEVSFSTTPGKAILVSGSGLKNLKELLDALSTEQVDVYTHGELLIAHAFEKFRQYPHLKGHFGTFSDNCVLDFATFPGPILLTRHSARNIEYLIRGRLFTSDEMAPKGVIKLTDSDYKPMLESLKSAKGFSKGRKKDAVLIGFNPEKLEAKLDEIARNFNSGALKHLFIIGMSNYSAEQSLYFHELLENIPKDGYVVTFSYHNDAANQLYINIANNFPLQLAVLDMLFKKIPPAGNNITVFLTKCDANTISSMISLKDSGIKRIYLSNCPPTLINPAIMNSFMRLFDIKHLTNAKNDLNFILNI